MTTLTRLAAATTAALALTLSLGACAISIGTPDSSDSGQSSAGNTPAPATQGTQGTQTTQAAQQGGSQSNAGGSNSNIIEPDWISLLNDDDATVMTPKNGQLTIDSAFVDAIVRDHVDTLTLTGTEIDIAATSVNHLVISGSFIDVYVEDVTTVTITGTYVDVVYAGTPPTVNDTGFDNTVREQSAKDDD